MAYELPPTYTVRPHRRLRAVLLLFGLAVLVCGIAASGVGVWTFQSVKQEEGPARAAAERFLADLAADDVDGAYGRLCARTRERMDRETFNRWVRAQPKIDRHEISEVAMSAGGEGLKATVTAKLSWESGVVARQALPLVAEEGHWRVCGNPV
ncbi:MAG TPA: hypothetical protein VFX61_03725 [Micromonosporaceae bacterium]|nr:hypothetical protein [Micromonosporaceae bacterium]